MPLIKSTLLFFLTPILFSLDSIRHLTPVWWAVRLNPFTPFILAYQDVRIERLSPSAATFQTPAGAQVGQHYHVVMVRSQFAF